MLDFYYQFAQVLEQENPVLATVIASKGSVPREIGAKMLILNNGEILQTIDEGAGEAKVIRAAMIVSATGRKRAIALDNCYFGYKILGSFLVTFVFSYKQDQARYYGSALDRRISSPHHHGRSG